MSTGCKGKQLGISRIWRICILCPERNAIQSISSRELSRFENDSSGSIIFPASLHYKVSGQRGILGYIPTSENISVFLGCSRIYHSCLVFHLRIKYAVYNKSYRIGRNGYPNGIYNQGRTQNRTLGDIPTCKNISLFLRILGRITNGRLPFHNFINNIPIHERHRICRNGWVDNRKPISSRCSTEILGCCHGRFYNRNP